MARAKKEEEPKQKAKDAPAPSDGANISIGSTVGFKKRVDDAAETLGMSTTKFTHMLYELALGDKIARHIRVDELPLLLRPIVQEEVAFAVAELKEYMEEKLLSPMAKLVVETSRELAERPAGTEADKGSGVEEETPFQRSLRRRTVRRLNADATNHVQAALTLLLAEGSKQSPEIVASIRSETPDFDEGEVS